MANPSLDTVKAAMKSLGVQRLLVKHLAANDNSKNQVYLAGSFEPLNILPARPPVPEVSASGRQVLHAAMDFSWLRLDGALTRAPHAKLILYPQYPEIRFSGFLLGSRDAPSEIMTERMAGRVLLLGIRPDHSVLGFAAAASSALAQEVRELSPEVHHGALSEISLPGINLKADLLTSLKLVAAAGWIDSCRLLSNGVSQPCNARNCGGFTLEAQLGITPNSRSEPDYLGWEVKQFGVTNTARYSARSPITLMTAEPTGGLYYSLGVEGFVRAYGYRDVLGRPDRLNFGGRFLMDRRDTRTRMTLTLTGYDRASGRIADVGGGIMLVDEKDRNAAFWPFPGLIAHWNRKHAQAAYIPSMSQQSPLRYQFGPDVFLGVGTDFGRFLEAVAAGAVFYDPAIKIESESGTAPRLHRRSQFRIIFTKLPRLYRNWEQVRLA